MEEHISRYYLGRDGRLHLKSKWPLRIKILLSTLFTIFSLTYIQPSLSSTSHITQKSIYESFLLASNPKLLPTDTRDIVNAAIKWSTEFNLDVKLLLSVAKIESNFNKHSISPSGAYGIMQVIPVWHKDKILDARNRLGNPELFNINTNIYLGARILRDCLNRLGNLDRALACYSGNTVGYQDKVMSVYRALKN